MTFFRSVRSICCTITLLLLCALAALWLYLPNWHYNIHTVIPNKIYRSAQLPESVLNQVVSEHHIQSIINLRNAHPKALWYQKEATLAKTHHIQLYNLSLPAFNMPSCPQLIQLATILNTATQPILIHCRHGADRSGLASSIALILANIHSPRAVLTQSSWHYLALSPHSVGKLVLPKYLTWLKHNHQIISKKSFFLWLTSRCTMNTHQQ